jgi:hypothetical protein
MPFSSRKMARAIRSKSAVVSDVSGPAIARCNSTASAKVFGLRRTLEIGANRSQAFSLHHWTDIIQHRSLENCRAHSSQNHDDQTAARRADERGFANAKRRHAGQNVAALDDRIIGFPVRRIGRAATAAVVEGDDLPWVQLGDLPDAAPDRGNRRCFGSTGEADNGQRTSRGWP